MYDSGANDLLEKLDITTIFFLVMLLLDIRYKVLGWLYDQ